MAVTKKGKGPNKKVLAEMKEAFLKQAEHLWKSHISEAVTILEDAEEPVIKLNFAATLNFKETSPKLVTTVRFTKSYTDEKVDEFEDPDQMPLGNIPTAAKGGGLKE